MTEALDVVRAAFAALERGDTATAFASFSPTLTYRLHGQHPLAGTFDGKQDALAALAALGRVGGPGSTLRLLNAWSVGPQLVVAHLVRRANTGSGPIEGAMASVLRVEDGAITELVTVPDRALEHFWATTST